MEARGLHLVVDGADLVVTPAAEVTAEDMAVLKVAKPEVVAHLRSRTLGIDWTRVSLRQLDRVLEVAVPWSDAHLVIAPGCRVAREVRESDMKPGRVWCTCEIIDLLLSGVTPEDARKIADARIAFDAGLAMTTKDSGR
jgi:hypothetical protein